MVAQCYVLPLAPSKYLEPAPVAGEAVLVQPGEYTGWADLLNSNPDATEFAFAAGDYTAWGMLQVADWAALKPRDGLVLRYADLTVVPWQRPDRALIAGLDFFDSTNVVVAGLTLTEQIVVRSSSSGFLIHENDISAPTYGVRLFGNSNVVQRNFVHDQTSGSDGVAIGIQPTDTENPPTDNVIANNEVRNWNDSFQITAHATEPLTSVDGTVVDGNDFFITKSMYLYEAGGEYANAENGIDIKVGTETTTGRVIISNNRIWGFRRTAPSVSSGGKNSNGAAITNHQYSRNVLFDGNIIDDVPVGVMEHQWIGGTVEWSIATPRGTEFRNNVWLRIRGTNTADESGGHGVYNTTTGVRIESDLAVDCSKYGIADPANPQFGDNWIARSFLVNTPVGDFEQYPGIEMVSNVSVRYQRRILTGPQWVRVNASRSMRTARAGVLTR